MAHIINQSIKQASKQASITGSIKDFFNTRVLSPLAKGPGFFVPRRNYTMRIKNKILVAFLSVVSISVLSVAIVAFFSSRDALLRISTKQDYLKK